MVIKKTPFQSFRLDLGSIADCISLISRGINTRHAIASELGMGEKKVEGLFEWAEFLGLINDQLRTRPQTLTDLGMSIASVPAFIGSVRAVEVLYAKVCLNHPLVNQVVNSFLYDISYQFEPTFDVERFKTALLDASSGFVVAPTFLFKRAGIYLDLLSNPENFGKLGIVVKQDKNTFRVNSRRPDWRSFAYILYDSWPENVSRVGIREIVRGHSNLGRIFCLPEPQVMVMLSKLEHEHIIALEMIADLYQVGRNPALKAHDFLEMLICDQG